MDRIHQIRATLSGSYTLERELRSGAEGLGRKRLATVCR